MQRWMWRALKIFFFPQAFQSAQMHLSRTPVKNDSYTLLHIYKCSVLLPFYTANKAREAIILLKIPCYL